MKNNDNLSDAIILLTVAFLYLLFNLAINHKYIRYWWTNRKHSKHINSQQNNMTIKKACKILGINPKEFKKMTKEDLKKAYRKKAKEVHPDHGGNSEDFRNVKDAFDFAYAA